MGAGPADLLRMLEPAVRPVGPGRCTTPRQPVESQSFESLLQEAKQTDAEAGPADADTNADAAVKSDSPRGPGPLSELSRLDAIENSALRQLLARNPDAA
jgi:hypothetical protein